jgi:hypothetical protein
METILNEFTEFCDLLIKTMRPTLPFDAGALTKLKHKHAIASLFPKFEKEIRDKANEILLSFAGDNEGAKNELIKIIHSKLAQFLNGR